MTAFINYMVEANLGLCFFVGVYHILLKSENDFGAQRKMMLIGIAASLLFPIIHINAGEGPLLTLHEVIPVTWLPEFRVGGDESVVRAEKWTLWNFVLLIYSAGIFAASILLYLRLVNMSRLIRSTTWSVVEDLRIAETNELQYSFSFFNFICIGNAKTLTHREKAQVIAHEKVHAKQLHSLDIIILQILSVVFWFNPIIWFYKKIFIQLHEFEADARSARADGVDEYCNLLARVALMSADIPMANYFNQSLTLKRIKMLRTIKHKFRTWKISVLAIVIIAFFVVTACHDQVIDRASDVAVNSSIPVDIPADVQNAYDALKEKNPEQRLILVEVDDKGQAKLEEMRQLIHSLDQSQITSINVIKHEAQGDEPKRNFMIIQHNEYFSAISERSSQDQIYAIVDESASPVGGMQALFEFLGSNIKYPAQAVQEKIEGVVMIEFVVEKDGTITNPIVKKGVEPSLDAEALRVVRKLPVWQPGKNAGEVVKQKMVLPISFKL